MLVKFAFAIPKILSVDGIVRYISVLCTDTQPKFLAGGVIIKGIRSQVKCHRAIQWIDRLYLFRAVMLWVKDPANSRITRILYLNLDAAKMLYASEAA